MTDTGEGAAPVSAIDVGDLLHAADGGDSILLLDVRNEDEVKAWKFEALRPIETVYVPYFDFIEDEAGSVAKVPPGRDIVVLCAQGGSSEMVAGMLADAGIPARNVRGGMVAYGEYLQPVAVPLEAAEASCFAIWQINRRGKGCLSYVVASNGEAVVVDPMKNIEWFEAFAAQHGLRITRVLDTHIHADHVSGGPALAAKLGVPYSVSAGEGFELRQPVTPLDDGQVLRVGGPGGVTIEVRVMRTPGHIARVHVLSGRRALLADRGHRVRDERGAPGPGRARRGMGPAALHHAHRAAGPAAGRGARVPGALRRRAGDRRKRRRLRDGSAPCGEPYRSCSSVPPSSS